MGAFRRSSVGLPPSKKKGKKREKGIVRHMEKHTLKKIDASMDRLFGGKTSKKHDFGFVSRET